MTKRKNRMSILTVAALCMLPVISLVAMVFVAKDWQTRFAFSGGFQKQCKSTHKAGGFVRDTMTLAEMSAIVSWTKEVTKYGLDYNFWSNAEKKLLRCKRVNGTRMINCVAWASPCRNIYKNRQPTIVAQKKQPQSARPSFRNVPLLSISR